MSEKTTSLDIQSGKGSILDIAKAFPMTRAQTLDLARHGKYIDGMLQGENVYKNIDFSEDAIIRITRFRT
ncbi:hypothetical protein HOO68_05460, partial [Candidatus Gracilibacteria bacterium]|nr:hypothetical protein [Candidatus Gracilibacteria bacterium]